MEELNEFIRRAEEFVFLEHMPEKADVIFIPGNGYPQMAERAARLYREGYAPYLLPSGKFSISAGHFSGVLAKKEQYAGQYETECEFLTEVLRRHGVPESAILMEKEASYTYENALKSKEVLEKSGLMIHKAILCCKTHHARRAYLYYQTVFPDVKILVCPVNADGITRENWKETQEGIAAVTGEMTRMIQQFSLMMK